MGGPGPRSAISFHHTGAKQRGEAWAQAACAEPLLASSFCPAQLRIPKGFAAGFGGAPPYKGGPLGGYYGGGPIPVEPPPAAPSSASGWFGPPLGPINNHSAGNGAATDGLPPLGDGANGEFAGPPAGAPGLDSSVEVRDQA